MNRLISVFILFIIISCKKESPEKEQLLPEIKSEATQQNSNLTLGKKIFNGKGQCLSCHQPNHKVIGPSIIEITTIYQDQGADMIAFLKGNADPIVDPAQFALM